MCTQHFLTLLDLSTEQLNQIIHRAVTLKQMHQSGQLYQPLKGRVLGMIFEKASTRTRVSFEAGMIHLGGNALFLSSRDTQLGRGEPIEDTARVLSSMVDGITVRTFEHSKAKQLAKFSSVPVINALTDLYHPCQLLADIMTFVENRGDIQGKTVAWVGDGNNMCHSYINAAIRFGFNLRIACPSGYDPLPEIVNQAGNRVMVTRDPAVAVKGAHLVVTDVWASMGQEEEQKRRLQHFQPFQVNDELMSHAANDVLFMHCLPAHREEEVTASVIDSPSSVVWSEAENRLHAQKALIEFLLVKS